MNFVVPPRVTKQILEALDPSLLVWLQPGSFDAEVAALAESRFEHAVVGDCIMVRLDSNASK